MVLAMNDEDLLAVILIVIFVVAVIIAFVASIKKRPGDY
jgi:NADH:ubiquinone oxidoreductase subunit 6 (subunit J)